MSGKFPFSLQILHAYYPVASTLREYLENALDVANHTDVYLLHETDTKQYRDLVETCIVAVTSNVSRICPEAFGSVTPLREVTIFMQFLLVP